MFTISVQEGSQYLLIVTSGTGTLAPVCAANAFVEEVLRRTGARRVLLDMMALDLVVTERERLEVVTSLLGGMGKLDRLAVVVPRGVSRGVLVGAARAASARAVEFDNILEAERWVVDDLRS